MQAYQRDFIRFAIDRGVLRFGEFTLKSGRTSPYFLNAGLFNTGSALAQLGRFYAAAIAESGISFDVLFGPAYKGIPLAATTAVALAEHHDRDLPWCFNRKEAKAHGEGGSLVGAPLTGDVLIIDDILDEGHTLGAIIDFCKHAGARKVHTAVLIDKDHDRKARPDLKADFVGLPCVDRYIFGYGMDYKGYWRNANGIFAVKGM